MAVDFVVMSLRFVIKCLMKNPGSATITSRNQPLKLRGTKEKQKVTRACKKNKEMHEKHEDQLSSPSEVITTLNRYGLKINENKEQGMTQYETPRSKNHKAT